MAKWILLVVIAAVAGIAVGVGLRPPTADVGPADVASPASAESSVDDFDEKPSPLSLGAGPPNDSITIAKGDGATDQGML